MQMRLFNPNEGIEFTEDIEPFNKEILIDFWKFILERQSIWYRRYIEEKPYPWTSDLTLKNYRFCNIYRELDKGTIYLIDRLKEVKEKETILFNVIMYRIYNYYGFFEDVDGPIKPDEYDVYKFIEKLDKVKESGRPLFSEAYMLHPMRFNNNYRPEEKHVQFAFLLEIVSKRIDDIISKINECETPRKSLEVMTKMIPNNGEFMAYEMWADLSYLDFFIQKWTDNDFVNIGNGARWGLNILTKEEDTNNFIYPKDKYEELAYKLRDMMKSNLKDISILDKWLKVHYKDAYSNVPFLSIRNIEHSLCEYRKYYRLKYLKKGRKRLYKL